MDIRYKILFTGRSHKYAPETVSWRQQPDKGVGGGVPAAHGQDAGRLGRAGSGWWVLGEASQNIAYRISIGTVLCMVFFFSFEGLFAVKVRKPITETRPWISPSISHLWDKYFTKQLPPTLSFPIMSAKGTTNGWKAWWGERQVRTFVLYSSNVSTARCLAQRGWSSFSGKAPSRWNVRGIKCKRLKLRLSPPPFPSTSYIVLYPGTAEII